jgi:hypothetical protein
MRDGIEPMVTFYCEDCQIEFDVIGTVERTDDEGGIVFVPVSTGGSYWNCPNDLMVPIGDNLPHDVSIVGAA